MTLKRRLETEANDDRKMMLLRHISVMPGIRYRELLRYSRLSNGVLAYHLAGLEEASLVQVERRFAKTTRYYPISVSEREAVVLSCLRHKPLRQIILFILDRDECTYYDIVDFTGKAPSTISSHLKHLKEAGLISISESRRCFLYSLTDRELVVDIVSKYKTSLVDKTVDNYVDMVEEL
jgi:predicted transcriptional regulator